VAWEDPRSGATNARPFFVSDLPAVRQSSGNQTQAAAQTVPFPGLVNGRIRGAGVAAARDFYRFRLDKNQKVVLEVFSRRVGTPMDPEIALYDDKGNLLQVDDDARGRDCRIERDLPAGEFTVQVRDIDDRGGPEYPYCLLLTTLTPRFRLVATPDAPKLARGGTVTLTVKLEKEDGFDADVAVSVGGLPAGVSAAAPLVIPKGKTEGTLTLAASPDAPLGRARIEVTGTGTLGETTVKAAAARTTETYNIQGTAFQRDLLGPILFVAEK
jgi:hypothetical protein